MNIKSKIATAIKIEALEGKEEKLASLLNQAANMVEDNEPGTNAWYALRLSKNTFLIFDTFSNESGRGEHFAGIAAGALKEHSENLIVGGWENGVVNNIENFDIVSGFSRD